MNPENVMNCELKIPLSMQMTSKQHRIDVAVTSWRHINGVLRLCACWGPRYVNYPIKKTKKKTKKKQEKAAKLREFKVFSHSTRTVLHVVAEPSHGKDRRFFLFILPAGKFYSIAKLEIQLLPRLLEAHGFVSLVI